LGKTEQKLILIVSLWLKSKDVSDFEAYERQAVRLLKKHGGRIERAVRVKKQSDNRDEPFEIHLVSFPNEKKFADYLADSEVRRSTGLRDKIIRRTEVISGYDVDIYHE
jgi:uncharacterized protein (DUF1330 family)